MITSEILNVGYSMNSKRSAITWFVSWFEYFFEVTYMLSDVEND